MSYLRVHLHPPKPLPSTRSHVRHPRSALMRRPKPGDFALQLGKPGPPGKAVVAEEEGQEAVSGTKMEPYSAQRAMAFTAQCEAERAVTSSRRMEKTKTVDFMGVRTAVGWGEHPAARRALVEERRVVRWMSRMTESGRR